jgi:glycerol-3-phosphate dehydrogenase subunit B
VTLDAVVVGAGVAGLTAAVRLAQSGRRVVVVAKGVGSTHLTGGTVDVLGYAPGRVESPREALPAFTAERPEHPYARLPVELLEESLSWFRGVTAGLDYRGTLDENVLLPTAVGAVRPSALVPRTMAGGDLRAEPRLLVAGFAALKDFYPALLADNLAGAGIAARACVLESSPRPGEADVGGLLFADAFDEAGFRAQVASELAGHHEPGEAVALPAVLGLADAPAVCAELEERVEAPVFEVPTLPPSAPGIRLYRALVDALRRAGGRLLVGSEAVGSETVNGRVDALVVQDSARRRRYPAHSFVLATGGFASGGLVADSLGNVRETVLGLPVSGVPEEGRAPFAPGYFDEQPLARAGLAVDDELRPVDGAGRAVFENVHAAGATLAGAEPWREKSGEGISVATGYRAAEAILAGTA